MPDGIFNESMGQGIIFSLVVMFSFVLLLLLLFELVLKGWVLTFTLEKKEI